MIPRALPMSIAGIGVDLLRVERIQATLARYGDRFAEKILGDDELQVFHTRCLLPARGVRYLATRFAAKEAFAKAIGLGLCFPMSWRNVQAMNTPDGRPVLVLAPPLLEWYFLHFGAAHVSLTDESDMVAAYVVIEARVSADQP